MPPVWFGYVQTSTERKTSLQSRNSWMIGIPWMMTTRPASLVRPSYSVAAASRKLA